MPLIIKSSTIEELEVIDTAECVEIHDCKIGKVILGDQNDCEESKEEQ